LATRSGNDFGKAPDELAAVMRWCATHGSMYEALGATMVDASRPLAQVVVDVIGTAELSGR
jgi:hypothetical protein